MKPHIRWTSVEIQKLAGWLFEEGFHVDHKTFVSAVREAQTLLLPANRHRHIKSYSNIPADLSNLITELWEPTPASAEKQEVEKNILGITITHPVHIQMGVMEQMQHDIASLHDKLDMLMNYLTNPVQEQAVENKPLVDKKSQKRIVIYGCNSDQLIEIQAANPHYKIKGFHSFATNLESNVKHADLVVGMTKFMSHGYEEHLKKVAGLSKYRRVTGAASTVNRVLREFFALVEES